ncbi:MAG: hypothetical protein SFU56_20475 [Capsulimonadales bacterium]|nr:hypothetical protein [Capsulimonadales bacterium]
MKGISEAEKMRYLSILRSWMIRRQTGRLPQPASVARPEGAWTRREFLEGAAASTLALGASGATLLAGCGSSKSVDKGRAMPAGTRVLVSTFIEGTIEALDARTGASLGTFFRQVDRGTTIAGVRVGPQGQVYAFSPGSNRFFICDGVTGAITREVKLPITQTPHCGSVGPDGNLYVVNAPSLNNQLGIGPDTVEIYTPDGEHIRRFIDGNDTPELRAPFGISWGPDGNLYVTASLAYFPFALGSDYVARFDSAGRFTGYVARDVKVPFNVNFHPDGYLMVIEHFYSRVALFDLRTGKIVDAFANADFCIDIQFGPDRNAYMTSFTDQKGIEALFNNDLDTAKNKGRILRYNGANGKPFGALAEKLVFSGYLAFA